MCPGVEAPRESQGWNGGCSVNGLRRQLKHIALSPFPTLVRYTVEAALGVPGQASSGIRPIESAPKTMQSGFSPRWIDPIYRAPSIPSAKLGDAIEISNAIANEAAVGSISIVRTY